MSFWILVGIACLLQLIVLGEVLAVGKPLHPPVSGFPDQELIWIGAIAFSSAITYWLTWKQVKNSGLLTLKNQLDRGTISDQSLLDCQAIFNALTEDLILILDCEGRYLKKLTPHSRLLKTPGDELIGKTLYDDFPTPQAQSFIQIIQQAIVTSQTLNLEYSLAVQPVPIRLSVNVSKLSDQTVLWIAHKVNTCPISPVEFPSCETNFPTTIGSEGKLGWGKLNKFGLNTLLCSWELDWETQTLIGSTEMCRLCNLEPCVPMNFAQFEQLIHPEDRVRQQEAIAQSFSTGQVYALECRLLQTDGNYRYVYTQGKPIFNASGEPLKLLGIYLDTTEFRQVQTAFQTSEARFKAIIKNSFDLIQIFDENFTLIYGNPAVTRLMGEQPRPIPIENGLQRIHPEDVPKIQAVMQQILAQPQTPITLEFRTERFDGAWTWLESIATNWLDSPEVRAIIVNSRDIGERKQVEEALRESEERFRATFEQVAVGMSHTDLNGKFLRVNQKLCEITGYSQAQLLTMTIEDVTTPEELKIKQQLVRSLIAGEIQQYSLEKHDLRQDGTWIWVHLTTSLVRLPSGEPSYFATVVEDISSRKQAEEQLQQAHQELQAIFEAFPDLFFRLAADGTIIDYRTSNLTDLYASPQDFTGKRLQEVMPESVGNQIYQGLTQALELGQIINLEYALSFSGKIRYFEAKLVRFQKNQVIAIVRNITERQLIFQELKQAEIALRNSEELFRQIAENICEAVYVCNFQQVLYMNPAYEQIWGISRDCLYPDINLWKTVIHPEDLPQVDAEIQDFSAPKTYHREYRIVRPDHSIRYVIDRSFPIRDASGNVYRYVGLVDDITERKTVEERLRQQAIKEQALNRVIQSIRNSLDLSTIFATAACETGKLLKVDRTEIVQYFPDRKLWINVGDYYKDSASPSALGLEVPDENNEITAQLKRLEVVRISDTRQCNNSINQQFTNQFPGAWLFVPICLSQTIWGSLSVIKNSPQVFWSDADVELVCTVADQLAIAIQQSQLYQKLQTANQELQLLIGIDSLTQVANRRRFDEYLHQEWLRLAREQLPLALIFCDIDYFKRYNDTYGHQAGDQCLQQVAQAMHNSVKRSTDLVARYGGEEFAAILPNTNLKGALIVAQEIQKSVQRLQIPHLNAINNEWITVSIGIASVIPRLEDSPGSLIASADQALYQAKFNGRNCVVTYDALSLSDG